MVSLLVVFLVAFLGAWVAKKLNQPVLTGYLLAGLISTIILGPVFQTADLNELADLGLAFLMFVVGMEFSFRRLSRVRNIAVFGAIIQMVLTTIIFSFFTGSILTGVVFSLSSTAIVVKLLSERGELDTLPSEIMVGWLLVQDLAVVPILTVLPAISVGGSLNSMVSALTFSLLKAAVLLYLVLILGKKIVPRLLTKVAETGSREVLLIAVVGLVLLSAAVTSYFGLSFALGAFLAGLLIAEGASQHAIFSEIRPLRDVFAVVFFVTLGVLVSPQFLAANWLMVLKFTLLVILVKFVVSLAVTLFFKYHLKTALQVGLSLTQVGEFAFVVARLGLSGSLIDQNTYSLILAVTILTMMVTPWQLGLAVSVYEDLRKLAARWSPRLYDLLFSSFDHYRKEHSEVELSDHVVICGHGRVGKHITRILAMAGVPYVVVDYNHNVTSELAATGVPTVLGDPTDREVLAFSGIGRAKAVMVAVPDRYSQELIIENALNLRPGVAIVCRSHFEEDHRRLYALGATAVVSPELEAGLSMSHRVLDSLGVDKVRTATYLKQARREVQ
ncbi:cation:proton antiporter [Patescibacteria group bacterium]|nr:cation:proton antiporter [Patescibacteria group bacterium]